MREIRWFLRILVQENFSLNSYAISCTSLALKITYKLVANFSCIKIAYQLDQEKRPKFFLRYLGDFSLNFLITWTEMTKFLAIFPNAAEKPIWVGHHWARLDATQINLYPTFYSSLHLSHGQSTITNDATYHFVPPHTFPSKKLMHNSLIMITSSGKKQRTSESKKY
jgi:hypothetical protein